MLKYGLYAFSIYFGLWHAADNPDGLVVWAAAASGMVLVLTGLGVTAVLYDRARVARLDLWLRWFIRQGFRRMRLFRTPGSCAAVNRLRWLRCTREPGHPNRHVHQHVDCHGVVVGLTGWAG